MLEWFGQSRGHAQGNFSCLSHLRAQASAESLILQANAYRQFGDAAAA